MRKRTLVAVLLGAIATMATAQPVTYGQEQVPIRAGVLVIESQNDNSVNSNFAPYVFYTLDRLSGLKPSGWTFINPAGQSTYTQDMRDRWDSRSGGAISVGTRLNKAAAPYWEVLLSSVSQAELSNYDVLSLTLASQVILTPRERELLRGFIDQGGVLIVDVRASAPNDPANPLPLGFVSTGFAPGSLEVDARHPLLSRPYAVTPTDLVFNSLVTNLGVRGTTAADLGATANTQGWVNFDGQAQLRTVAGTVGSSVASVGKIGEGYMIVLTNGASQALSRGIQAGSTNVVPNNQVISQTPAVDRFTLAAARLYINAINLASGATSPTGGSRNSGASAITVNAPLVERFARDLEGFPPAPGRTSVIVDGYIVVSRGGRIEVYDADPARDRTGDGNPDDGIPDGLIQQGDLVWRSTTVAPDASAPTIIDVPGRGKDIWVTGSNGSVYVFPLENLGDNIPPAETIAPPSGVAPNPYGPHAPTFHEGMVFITDVRASDNAGRVWVIEGLSASAVTTTGAFAIQGSGRFRIPSGPATIGYIPINDNSGGVDRVLYVPTAPDTATNTPAGVTSIWLGARGESPAQVTQAGNTVTINPRGARRGLPLFDGPNSPFSLKITLLRFSPLFPDGIPLTTAEMATAITNISINNAQIVLTVAGGLDFDGNQTPGNQNDDIVVRLDYTLDWGRTGGVGGVASDAFVRGNLEVADTGSPTLEVKGPVSLSQHGNLIFNTGPIDPSGTGGSVYNLREIGQGVFSLQYRWDLYNQFSFGQNGAPGGTGISYGPTLLDRSNLRSVIPFLAGEVSGFRIDTPPAVRGEQVLVAIRASKPIGPFQVPTGIIAALDANPGPPSFLITVNNEQIANRLRATQAQTQLAIVQPDLVRSTNKAAPEVISTVGAPNIRVIPIDNNSTQFRLEITSLMQATSGRITDALSTSQPIIVRINQPGNTPSLNIAIEPELALGSNQGPLLGGGAAGGFSPLNWFYVADGMNLETAPRVTGRVVYFGGASSLPSIVTGGSPVATRGLLNALDIELDPNSSFLGNDATRPWQRQLNTLTFNNGTNFANGASGSPAFLWPQYEGIETVDDFRIRTLQASVQQDATVRNLAVADGTLVVNGDNGLYAFSRAEFVIADEGRVSVFDSVGNPQWSTDATLVTGVQSAVSTAGTPVTLSTPTRVRTMEDGSRWIVDTGADRIVRIDASGRESRAIQALELDVNNVPEGFPQGGPLRLRQPRDIFVYTSLIPQANNPYTNAQPLERWEHVVIADSGNRRVIEVIDRLVVNPNGTIAGAVQFDDGIGGLRPALGVVHWHTPTELSGSNYIYNSISRAVIATGGGGFGQAYVFGFGNLESGAGRFGLDSLPTEGPALEVQSGAGGVVVYEPNGEVKIINEFIRPPIAANRLIGEEPGNPGTFAFNLPVDPQPARAQKITGLQSVTARYVLGPGGDPALAVMIADNTGVYEVIENGAGEWVVRWMLPAQAYVGMRRPGSATTFSANDLRRNPRSFQPRYAQRLDSGEVLIVNGYFGSRFNNTAFSGEVVVVDGRLGDASSVGLYNLDQPNLGFNSLSFRFLLPPVQGIRDIVNPVFAERQ